MGKERHGEPSREMMRRQAGLVASSRRARGVADTVVDARRGMRGMAMAVGLAGFALLAGLLELAAFAGSAIQGHPNMLYLLLAGIFLLLGGWMAWRIRTSWRRRRTS